MYEQMEFDLRLEYERNLKDNLNTVAKFAGEQMRQNMSDEGRPLKTVESKQEAYGVAAQQYVRVSAQAKLLKNQMDDFLKLLEADSGEAAVVGTIYNISLELAQESILMAAQASRILADLYYQQPRTPVEEYLSAADLEDSDMDEEAAEAGEAEED